MPFPPLADQAPCAIRLTAGSCGIGFHLGPRGDADQMAAHIVPMGIARMLMAMLIRPYAYGYRCWWCGGGPTGGVSFSSGRRLMPPRSAAPIRAENNEKVNTYARSGRSFPSCTSLDHRFGVWAGRTNSLARDFQHNPDDSWTPLKAMTITAPNGRIRGRLFRSLPAYPFWGST